MPIGIFGRKLGMTQIFDDAGQIQAVTLVKAEVCQVSQIKTTQTDGYNGIQVAYGQTTLNNLNKPQQGHLKKATSTGFKYFGEFRTETPDTFKLGEEITLENFLVGDKLRVTGKSIGKGFAGCQKRHNFSRGPMTHGSKNHRLPGSIGAGTTPGRVYPGKKMAGRLGNKKITIKNTEILAVNIQEKVIVLKGSLPGKAHALLKLQTI
jgi:large subunit ribosomal protein L3